MGPIRTWINALAFAVAFGLLGHSVAEARCSLDGAVKGTRWPTDFRGYLPASLWQRLKREPTVHRDESISPTERCLSVDLAERATLDSTSLEGLLVREGFTKQVRPDGMTAYLRTEGRHTTTIDWAGNVIDTLAVRVCVVWKRADACAQRLITQLGKQVTAGRREYRRGAPIRASYVRREPADDIEPALVISATFPCSAGAGAAPAGGSVNCEHVPESDGYTDGRGESDWYDKFTYELSRRRTLTLTRMASKRDPSRVVELELALEQRP